MLFENQYRTNTCGELRQNNIGSSVQTIRDHGGVLFVDIRDQYGVVQTVFHDETLLKGVTKESVVSIGGTVVQRAPETVNPKIPTGYVEVAAESLTVLSRAIAGLPFEIDPSKYRPALPDYCLSAPEDDQFGLFGDSNADPVRILTGRRTGLSGAKPEASRPVLCTAAGSSDF